MKGEMDKSLFFLLMSFVCIWLVLDVAVGNDRLGNFLETMFPFMKGTSNSSGMTAQEVEEAKKNAPSSSAMGSGYSVPGTTGPMDQITGNYQTSPGINIVPYGATRPGVN